MASILFILPSEPKAYIKKKLRESLTEYLFMKNIFKRRIAARLFIFINRKLFNNGISEVITGYTDPLLIMRLPLDLERLKRFNINLLQDFLDKICTARGVAGIILPTALRRIINRDQRDLQPDYGKLLVKALLINILKEIYEKNGVKLGSIDTSILHGGNHQELLACLKNIEPEMKYVTIVYNDREELTGVIKEFTEETGLSVGILNDGAEAIINSKLIISFVTPSEVQDARLRHGSVFLNLNMEKAVGLRGGGTVINGVFYCLSESYLRKLPVGIMSSFRKDEISEIILCSCMGNEGSEFGGVGMTESGQMEALRKAFVETGCRITGFMGRKGRIELPRLM